MNNVKIPVTKNIHLLFIVFIAAVVGYNNQKEEFTTKYDELMKENDSIEQVHSEFSSTHQQMTQNHNGLSQQMESVEIEDSTFLKKWRNMRCF